jgi:hypothetical protein
MKHKFNTSKPKQGKEAAYAGRDAPVKANRVQRPKGTPADHPLNKARAAGNTSLVPGPHHAKHKKTMPVTVISSEGGHSHVAEPPPKKV